MKTNLNNGKRQPVCYADVGVVASPHSHQSLRSVAGIHVSKLVNLLLPPRS